MTVRENLGFALKIAGQEQTVITARVGDAAAILGLDQLLDRTPAQLSGGQRQRVAMGRAIVRHPDAFLFDEPLSNLDAKLRVQMRTEIKRLHQQVEATIVYVTHDQVEAMTLADRIVVMRDGRIEQVGEPIDIFKQPANSFVASFIGSPPMNLLPGTITAGYVVFQDGSRLPVPKPLTQRVTEGQAVLLGIRPDDINPIGHGTSTPEQVETLELSVLLAEPLGTETILYTKLAGHEIQAVMFDPRRVQSGEKITFQLAMTKAHLFDASTQQSLAYD